MNAPPTPAFQLDFLTRLQRLFSEGDFTATYKFALLISLADLAVEQGHDDGDSLRLTTQQIADKFIDLYWQQTSPYSSGRLGTVAGTLIQNNKQQATIITALSAFRRDNSCSSSQAARSLPAYTLLRSLVQQTVARYPVSLLQNVGSGKEPFLYEHTGSDVILHPGVSYCFRRFQPLVQQLARRHWVDHVKHNRLNQPRLGEADDLESFLFETPRQALAIIGDRLRRLTDSQCFYCGSKVHDADVDHFVPFSIYPRDLMHNFVLAHPACNRSKSDTLAARLHVEHWLEHITQHDDALREIGEAAGRIADLSTSRAVARWGYANAVTGGSQAWLRARTYEPVDVDYLRCLA